MKNKFLRFGIVSISIIFVLLSVFLGCNKDKELPKIEFTFDVEVNEFSESRERGIDEEIEMNFKIIPAHKNTGLTGYSFIKYQIEIMDDNGKQINDVEVFSSQGNSKYKVTPFKKLDVNEKKLKLFFKTKQPGINKVSVIFYNGKHEVKKTFKLRYVEYPFEIESISTDSSPIYQGQEMKYALRINPKVQKSNERYFAMFSDDAISPEHQNTILKFQGVEILKNTWIEIVDIKNIPISLNSWVSGDVVLKMKIKNSTTLREYEIHKNFKKRKLIIERAIFDKREVFNRDEKVTLSLLVTKEPIERPNIGEEDDQEKLKEINQVWVKTITQSNIVNRMDSYQKKTLFNQERLDLDFSIQSSGTLDKDDFQVEIADKYGNVASRKLDESFSYRKYDFSVVISNQHEIESNTYAERSPVGIQYKILTSESQDDVNNQDINSKVRYYVSFEGDFQRGEQLYIGEDNKKVAKNLLLLQASKRKTDNPKVLWFEPQKIGQNRTRTLVLKFLQVVDGRKDENNIEKKITLNIPLGNPRYSVRLSSPTLSASGIHATISPYQWIDVVVEAQKQEEQNIYGGEDLYISFNGQIEFKEEDRDYIYSAERGNKLHLGRVNNQVTTKRLKVRWVPKSKSGEDLQNKEGIERVYIRSIISNRDSNVAKAELEFNAKVPFFITQIEHKSNAWRCDGNSFWARNRWKEQVELRIRNEHIKKPIGKNLSDYNIKIYNIGREEPFYEGSLDNFVRRNDAVLWDSGCSVDNKGLPNESKKQFVIEVKRGDVLVWKYTTYWHYSWSEPNNYFYKKEKPINPTINPEP